MAITIQHTYTTHTYVNYYYTNDNEILPWHLDETLCDNLDAIAEHVCEVLVRHNFVSADVCDAETGEVLMIIERS